MAVTTFLSNATVAIGAVDVSDQCSAVMLTDGHDQLETTTMGAGVSIDQTTLNQ